MNVLDLHGYSLHDAYIETIEFLKDIKNNEAIREGNVDEEAKKQFLMYLI